MKEKNKIHFLYVPFVGLGLHNGFRGDAWLKERIQIFKNYTLRALLAQTKQEFIIWISWTSLVKNNPIVKRFIQNLDGIRGIRVVHTFHGLCFWDDKYNDEIAYTRLNNALYATLPELKEYVPEDTDFVYMTIQPSDDMYLPDAVKTIQTYTKVGAFGWKNGYIMDYRTKEVAEYNPQSNPPFYTILFEPKVFLDPIKHMEFTGPYKSHEYVPYNHPPMEGRMFVVGTHGRNISTVYNHPWKGRVLSQSEADSVLIATNTYFTDPIIQSQGLHLSLRNLFNKIPFNDFLRATYHKLPANLRKL